MARQTRRAKKRRPPAADWQRHYLLTGQYPTQDTDPVAWNRSLDWQYFDQGNAPLSTWNELRDALIAEHVATRPGTRPWAWWHFEATEQRQRVGGTGITPWDAGLAVIPRFERGLPVDWDDIDPDDPPLFESQAEYLRRLGLLAPAEGKSLRVEALQPDAIVVADDK